MLGMKGKISPSEKKHACDKWREREREKICPRLILDASITIQFSYLIVKPQLIKNSFNSFSLS